MPLPITTKFLNIQNKFNQKYARPQSWKPQNIAKKLEKTQNKQTNKQIIPCSWTKKFNIVKLPILSKLISRFSAITTEILEGIYED